MVKRPSEEDIKPDISRTKRTASSEAPVTEEENIQAARAALDRLDCKSTIEICSGVSTRRSDEEDSFHPFSPEPHFFFNHQIVEASQVSDAVTPLLLRSIALGKIGQPYQSVQDVETALSAKQSRSVSSNFKV